MKVLIAASNPADGAMATESVTRAGLHSVSGHRFRSGDFHSCEVAALLVLGLNAVPDVLGSVGDLPIGVVLTASDLEAARREPARADLHKLAQRGDAFFVESRAVGDRLVGVLGVLGRLNRYNRGTSLVQTWCPNMDSDCLTDWITSPRRAPDAGEDWPRLGGDPLSVEKGVLHPLNPRRWLRRMRSWWG